MTKDGFIIYKSLYEPIRELTREQKGELLDLMFEYQLDNNFKRDVNDPLVKMAFKFFRNQFDIDNKKYVEKCAKNKENILKRWNTNEYERIRTNTIATDKDNEKGNEKEKDREKDKANEKDRVAVNEKKHKHGKYTNVLLTNPEVEKLKKKFPNYDAVLQNFSEGIALKDYKYKSHYLAILKWNRNNQQENVKLTYEEVLKIHSGDFKTPGDKEIWDKLEKIKENDKTYWVYK